MSSSPRRIDIKSKPYRRFIRGTGAALVIYPLLAWGIHYMLFGKILVNPAKLWVPILAMIMVGLFVRGLFALAMPTAYARFFRLPRTNQPDMLIALLRFIASGLLMAFAITAYHIPYNEPLLIAWQAFVVLALLSQVRHVGLLNRAFLHMSDALRYVSFLIPQVVFSDDIRAYNCEHCARRLRDKARRYWDEVAYQDWEEELSNA